MKKEELKAISGDAELNTQPATDDSQPFVKRSIRGTSANVCACMPSLPARRRRIPNLPHARLCRRVPLVGRQQLRALPQSQSDVASHVISTANAMPTIGAFPYHMRSRSYLTYKHVYTYPKTQNLASIFNPIDGNSPSHLP